MPMHGHMPYRPQEHTPLSPWGQPPETPSSALAPWPQGASLPKCLLAIGTNSTVHHDVRQRLSYTPPSCDFPCMPIADPARSSHTRRICLCNDTHRSWCPQRSRSHDDQLLQVLSRYTQIATPRQPTSAGAIVLNTSIDPTVTSQH